LTTSAGQYYDLSFLVNFLSNPNISNEVKVTWGGGQIFDQAIPSNGFDYTPYSVLGLQASGGSTVLGLSFKTDADYLNLDDVSVTQSANVPLPGAVWLLGSGLLGLMGFRKKTFGPSRKG